MVHLAPDRVRAPRQRAEALDGLEQGVQSLVLRYVVLEWSESRMPNRLPDPAVFSRNYRGYLEHAVRIARKRPDELVTFRSNVSWRSAHGFLHGSPAFRFTLPS